MILLFIKIAAVFSLADPYSSSIIAGKAFVKLMITNNFIEESDASSTNIPFMLKLVKKLSYNLRITFPFSPHLLRLTLDGKMEIMQILGCTLAGFMVGYWQISKMSKDKDLDTLQRSIEKLKEKGFRGESLEALLKRLEECLKAQTEAQGGHPGPLRRRTGTGHETADGKEVI